MYFLRYSCLFFIKKKKLINILRMILALEKLSDVYRFFLHENCSVSWLIRDEFEIFLPIKENFFEDKNISASDFQELPSACYKK